VYFIFLYLFTFIIILLRNRGSILRAIRDFEIDSKTSLVCVRNTLACTSRNSDKDMNQNGMLVESMAAKCPILHGIYQNTTPYSFQELGDKTLVEYETCPIYSRRLQVVNNLH
jgi:hypothetical protein